MGTTEPDRERIMSESTTEKPTEGTAATEVEAPQSTEAATAEKDWQAEADKWKSLARKHEDQSKANADKAKRFDEFEESQKTEQQKLADAAAKAEARAAETAAELARVKAAVKHGLSEDDLDLLGTHGTPEEIEARAERLAARLKAAGESKPKPDLGGGDRGEDVGAKGGQITSREALKTMTPEEINQARVDGRLDTLLGIKT